MSMTNINALVLGLAFAAIGEAIYRYEKKRGIRTKISWKFSGIGPTVGPLFWRVMFWCYALFCFGAAITPQ